MLWSVILFGTAALSCVRSFETHGVLLLYVIGAPVYWFGGKRRLIAALQARATGEEPGA